MTTESDHDILIGIARDTEWIKKWAVEHERQDAAAAERVRLIAEAAHKRVDDTSATVNERISRESKDANDRIDGINGKLIWILVSGVLSIVGLSITMFITHKGA